MAEREPKPIQGESVFLRLLKERDRENAELNREIGRLEYLNGVLQRRIAELTRPSKDDNGDGALGAGRSVRPPHKPPSLPNTVEQPIPR